MAELISVTPGRIDELAREICELEIIADRAQEVVDQKKADALELVLAFGRAPAQAAKSRAIEGAEFEITATFGQTSKVVPAKVEALAAMLKETRQRSLFPKLFLTEAKYMVAPDSGLFLPKLTAKATALFQQCVIVIQQKPRVSVRPKKGSPAARDLERQRNELITA